MQEELQGKLVEILTQNQSTVGQAKDFTLQQLPDIAQSYIYYGMAYSVVWTLIGLGLCYLSYFFYKKTQEPRNSWGDDKITEGFVSAISGLIGVIITAGTLQNLLLVWFAPKVWLLKEIAVLLK
jgi:hypothetical protein